MEERIEVKDKFNNEKESEVSNENEDEKKVVKEDEKKGETEEKNQDINGDKQEKNKYIDNSEKAILYKERLLQRPPDVSKNSWKKKIKKEQWDSVKKQKRAELKIRKKLKKKNDVNAVNNNNNIKDFKGENKQDKFIIRKKPEYTVIIDCGFDELMNEKERISLSAQITRCYSFNKKSTCPVNLEITSFNKKLLERFNTVLSNQHMLWKDITFIKEDYNFENLDKSKVIYLSSDSEDTLNELSPGMVYIIGGIVDKGRYKNLCKNKAEKKKIKTAKLPISEYIKISGRKVLTTNHVFEIILHWNECRDWKKAFELVIPPRKLIDYDRNNN